MIAPAVEMKPSTTTGTLLAAAPIMSPAMPAISAPPTLASTSMGSFGSGLFTLSASSMTVTLWLKTASFMPVPLPVTVSTGAPSSAAIIALEGVVLAMPISPVPNMATPPSDGA